MEDTEVYEEIETEVIETNIIEGQMVDFYFDRFLKKNQDFKDLKYLKRFQFEDLYNIYFSRKYNYTEGDPVWTDILSKFDKTIFKFLTNWDPIYCERLLPIFYKYLNNIYKDIEEEKERKKQEKKSQKSQQTEEQGEPGQGNASSDEEGEEEEEKEESAEQEKEEEKKKEEQKEAKIDDIVEQAIEEAKKEVEKQQKKEKEEQKRSKPQTGANFGKGSRGEADPKIVMDLLNRVDLRSNAIDEFIKKTIKSFREHFSNISKFEIEPLLEAEEMDEIDGIELFPFTAKYPFLWDEIYNISKTYSCVVDCFIDNSGSMTSTTNINSNYNSFSSKGGTANMVRMIDLSKVLAYKLYQKKYVADLYRFEGDCEKININESLRLSGRGGTNIDNVIRIVKNTKRPSLVITDGEDRIDEYSDLIYIINVSSSAFERMVSTTNGAVKKMIDNNQIMAFIDNRFLTPSQYNKYKKG